MRGLSRRLIFAISILASVAAGTHSLRAQSLTDDEIATLGQELLFGPAARKSEILARLTERGNPDVIAILILVLRYRHNDPDMLAALSALTGSEVSGWNDAMLWQEAHPEIIPHPSYRDLKLDLFNRIDSGFLRFLGEERSLAANMKIRLEEIVWGGVAVDGIPSLDDPELIAADDADYLREDDLVFGVAIDSDVRAYPLRIMGWHEMFNETIGGIPVALAYCTLCGAGILFETQVEGRERPFVFGSSGLLYRSNKLMFDRETGSLWNQFTGKPVTGPLAQTEIELKIRPVVITSWAAWKTKHPGTKVLSLSTGYQRDYGSGVVYRGYFASSELMFPAIVRNESVVKRKDHIFGIRTFAAARAWPLEAFAKTPVINDRIGTLNVVLIGDFETRTVRAYERGEHRFEAGSHDDQLVGPGGIWTFSEDRLLGPDGTELLRIAGHVSYWFAWDGYLGVKSSLYQEDGKP